jgi:hypothetical protein
MVLQLTPPEAYLSCRCVRKGMSPPLDLAFRYWDSGAGQAGEFIIIRGWRKSAAMSRPFQLGVAKTIQLSGKGLTSATGRVLPLAPVLRWSTNREFLHPTLAICGRPHRVGKRQLRHRVLRGSGLCLRGLLSAKQGYLSVISDMVIVIDRQGDGLMNPLQAPPDRDTHPGSPAGRPTRRRPVRLSRLW